MLPVGVVGSVGVVGVVVPPLGVVGDVGAVVDPVGDVLELGEDESDPPPPHAAKASVIPNAKEFFIKVMPVTQRK